VIRRAGGARRGNHHHQNTSIDLVLIFSKNFTQPSPNPIPDYGAPYPSRNNYPNAGTMRLLSCWRISDRQSDQSTSPRLAFASHEFKFRRAREATRFRKRRISGHNPQNAN
jgi:hypothetical protein